MDAIPGRTNHAKIYIIRPGTYLGFCAEICGVGHSRIPIVVSGIPLDYWMKSVKTAAIDGDRWLEKKFGRKPDHRVIRPKTMWQ